MRSFLDLVFSRKIAFGILRLSLLVHKVGTTITVPRSIRDELWRTQTRALQKRAGLGCRGGEERREGGAPPPPTTWRARPARSSAAGRFSGARGGVSAAGAANASPRPAHGRPALPGHRVPWHRTARRGRGGAGRGSGAWPRRSQFFLFCPPRYRKAPLRL